MSKKPHDKWIKCISTGGTLRGVAIQATGLVSEMSKMHSLNGMQAMGMGELVMGSLLLASYCKQGERVNLNIRGQGQFIQGLSDAYPDGTVRGYVIPRAPDQAFFGENNELGPWGPGMLSVLRAKSEPGVQPYIGTVPLVTGHLAKDLTFYWTQSEQVASAVGLAVNVDGNEVVTAGAGDAAGLGCGSTLDRKARSRDSVFGGLPFGGFRSGASAVPDFSGHVLCLAG